MFPTGLQYDKDGKENPWWSEEMKKKFWMKARCFVDQYNSYVIDAAREKNVSINYKLWILKYCYYSVYYNEWIWKLSVFFNTINNTYSIVKFLFGNIIYVSVLFQFCNRFKSAIMHYILEFNREVRRQEINWELIW